jgi:hypothetical protein
MNMNLEAVSARKLVEIVLSERSSVTLARAVAPIFRAAFKAFTGNNCTPRQLSIPIIGSLHRALCD